MLIGTVDKSMTGLLLDASDIFKVDILSGYV